MRKLLFITGILVIVDQGVKLLMSAFIGDNIVVLIPNLLQIELELNSVGYMTYFTSFAGGLRLLFDFILCFLALTFGYKVIRFCSPRYKCLDIWVYFICAGAVCFLLDCIFWGGSLDFIAFMPKTSYHRVTIICDIKDIYMTAFAVAGALRFILFAVDGVILEIKERKNKEFSKKFYGELKQVLLKLFVFKDNEFLAKINAKTVKIMIVYVAAVLALTTSVVVLDYTRENSGNYVRIDGTHVSKSVNELNIYFGNFSGSPNIRLRTPLTDSDIKALEYMTDLTELGLLGNNLPDIDVLTNALTKMPDLTSLWLTANRIEDISALSSFSQLEYLYIGGNKISDVSVLAGLTNLKELYVGGNPIEPDQIEELKAALPNTAIYTEHTHSEH